MRVLSSAFYRLKTIIPWVPHDTKLSKLDTLRLARNYISYLSSTLAGESVNDISNKMPHPQKMVRNFYSLSWFLFKLLENRREIVNNYASFHYFSFMRDSTSRWILSKSFLKSERKKKFLHVSKKVKRRRRKSTFREVDDDDDETEVERLN